VPSKEALSIFLRSLDQKSYYDILGVPKSADRAAISAAFHHFSLLYHPDRHLGSAGDVVSIAAEVYKLGVEAYRCLSRARDRARYDRQLGRGKIRIESSHSTVPPAAELRTLDMVARTPRGKKYARAADRLIAIGKLGEARVQLVSALQNEPDNAELNERLQLLFEALALEPP
jgi:curved DNA-binding protein CbpA